MPPKKKFSKTIYKFPQSFHDLPKSLSKNYYQPEPESIINDQIIIIKNFFNKDLCNELIKSFETQLNMETTPLIKSKEYAARFNDRLSMNDLLSANILWQYLQKILLDNPYNDEDLNEINQIFQDAVGLNPQLRVYRYTRGHHFGKHYDDSVICPIPPQGTKKGYTTWTLLIYLTGDEEFKGGGTIFYSEIKNIKPLNIHPNKGMALLHKHGDDCLKHEAEMVANGAKWVLRSDVVFPI